MAVIELGPPKYGLVPSGEPLVFLAGPIQGAPNWQKQAVDTLSDFAIPGSGFFVANPRRSDYDESPGRYEEQVSWEKHHLDRARDFGAIIFWLAKQDPSIEYEEGRSYGQTTRIEFGRALGWLDYDDDIQVVLGMEPGYEGSERYYGLCAAEHGLTVHQDLTAVCRAAVSNVS